MSYKKGEFKANRFTQETRYTCSVAAFKGVDYTNPQMSVASTRGSYSLNYLFDGALVHKRMGRHKIGYVDSGATNNFFRGMWQFTGESGKRHSIAWVGDSLYEVTFNSLGRASFSLVLKNADWLDNADVKRGYAVAGQNHLWLLTGIKYLTVYEDDDSNLQVSAVRGSDYAFVPTIRILSAPENAATIPDDEGATYDYKNLLTPWVQETFLTGLGVATNDDLNIDEDGRLGFSVYHTLNEYSEETEGDSSCFPSLEVSAYNYTASADDTVEYGYSFTKRAYYTEECATAFIPASKLSIKSSDKMAPLANEVSSHDGGLMVFTDTEGALTINAAVASGASVIINFGPWGSSAGEYIDYRKASNGAFYDKIPFTVNSNETIYLASGLLCNVNQGSTAELILPAYLTTVTTGTANVTLKYQSDSEGDSDFIDKCTMGCRFGHNNSLNRLWLYGNPDKPNYVIHSFEPNMTLADEDAVHAVDGDYSYISDEGYIKFGEDINSIVALEVVDDDKMMILKNRNGTERTMFYITPTTVTVSVTDDITYDQEEYSTSLSNTTTAGINASSMADFNGDICFISSDKQVVGLDVEGITGDAQKVANTRSYYIDGMLKELDLSEAKLVSSGDYMFLLTDEYCFATNRNSYDSDTAQYEWWPTDAIDGFCCLIEDDEKRVMYGDEDGNLWSLEFDSPLDKDRYFINKEVGDIATSLSETITTTSSIVQEVEEKGGDWKFLPTSGNVYRRLTAVDSLELMAGDDYVYRTIDSDTIKSLVDGTSAYFVGKGKVILEVDE